MVTFSYASSSMLSAFHRHRFFCSLGDVGRVGALMGNRRGGAER